VGAEDVCAPFFSAILSSRLDPPNSAPLADANNYGIVILGYILVFKNEAKAVR
jgi:hypothetical protein